MTRDEVQRKIADINRQINEEVAKSPVPKIQPKFFPVSSFIFAALAAGWWLFGESLPSVGQYYKDYGELGKYAAIAFLVIGVIRTALWMFAGKPKEPTAFKESTMRVRELQDRRRELEMQLKELQAD